MPDVDVHNLKICCLIACFSDAKRYVDLQPFGEGIPFTIFPDLVIGLRFIYI